MAKNNFETLIKVFSQKSVIVPVRLFGRLEYISDIDIDIQNPEYAMNTRDKLHETKTIYFVSCSLKRLPTGRVKAQKRDKN